MDVKSNSPAPKTIDEAEEKLLKEAHARFKLAAEATADIRREALDDLKFSAGDQWDPEIKNARNRDKRPSLTINRLPQFVRQITNDQLQNDPSIKVDPVDDNGDKETAEVSQGLIRNIEYSSNADSAKSTAFECAVRTGFGYFGLYADYCDNESFDQELKFRRFPNQFKIYLDPSSREPDGSDAAWAFIVDDLTKEQYEEQFPNSELTSLESFASIGDNSEHWMLGDKIRIAEYFYKEFKNVTIVMLSSGTVVPKDQLPNPLPEGIEIKQERIAKVPIIKWAKLNGCEFIEKPKDTVFDEWIPIIPVYGEDLEIDGKRMLSGVVRNAKDSQRMYNYWASAETEAIALAPRAPFVGVEGQFEGHEQKWSTANSQNHAYLEVRGVSISGVPAPMPQRQSYEPAVQAITGARREAAEDLKATTGIYDAALGNKSNESSGVAIQRRNQQSQTSNFHFVNNLERSIRHAGRILVRAIPKVYDAKRSVRIIGEDGKQDMVPINQVYEKNGEQVAHNLDAGKYDVTVDTGPSYATRRQEAAASQLDFLKVYPAGAQLIADLIASNMDWPGADLVAERLKKGLPPGIADSENEQQPLPPEVKQKMDQMGQMVDQLTKQLHAAHDAMDGKKLELDSRERMNALDNQTRLEIALASLGAKNAQVLLANQISEIQHERDLSHEKEMHELQPPQQDAPQEESMEQPAMAAPQMPTGGQTPGSPVGQP